METIKVRTILRIDNSVGIIVLNHPKTMNALDDVLFSELQESTQQLLDDPAVGSIVLTGADRAFCAGGDLKKLGQGFSAIEGQQYMSSFHPWVKQFMNASKPTIAAINGYAVGAGFCIAMLADIILASHDAVFGMAFSNVGLIPDLAGLYTLPRLVGLQRAKELIYTGRNLTAEQAQQWGIVNEIHPKEELANKAIQWGEKLANGPRIALRLGKQILNRSDTLTLEQLLDTEAQAQAICFQTQDHTSAVQAFSKKEKPVFTGR